MLFETLLLSISAFIITLVIQELIKTPFLEQFEQNVLILIFIFLYLILCLINLYYECLFLYQITEFPNNIDVLTDTKQNFIISHEQIKDLLKKDLNILKNLNSSVIRTDTFWTVLDKLSIKIVFFVPIWLGFMDPFNINLIDQKTLILFKDIMNSFIYTDKIETRIYSDLDYSLKALGAYIRYGYPIPWDVDEILLKKYFIRVSTILIILKEREKGISLIDLMIYDTERNVLHITACINSLNFNLFNFY